MLSRSHNLVKTKQIKSQRCYSEFCKIRNVNKRFLSPLHAHVRREISSWREEGGVDIVLKHHLFLYNLKNATNYIKLIPKINNHFSNILSIEIITNLVHIQVLQKPFNLLVWFLFDHFVLKCWS